MGGDIRHVVGLGVWPQAGGSDAATVAVLADGVHPSSSVPERRTERGLPRRTWRLACRVAEMVRIRDGASRPSRDDADDVAADADHT